MRTPCVSRLVLPVSSPQPALPDGVRTTPRQRGRFPGFRYALAGAALALGLALLPRPAQASSEANMVGSLAAGVVFGYGGAAVGAGALAATYSLAGVDFYRVWVPTPLAVSEVVAGSWLYAGAASVGGDSLPLTVGLSSSALLLILHGGFSIFLYRSPEDRITEARAPAGIRLVPSRSGATAYIDGHF